MAQARPKNEQLLGIKQDIQSGNRAGGTAGSTTGGSTASGTGFFGATTPAIGAQAAVDNVKDSIAKITPTVKQLQTGAQNNAGKANTSGSGSTTGGASQPAAAQPAAAAQPGAAMTDPGTGYGYQPSEAVNNALAYLQQQQAAMAEQGQYQGSPYDQDIQNAYAAIVNRGPFNYDINSDALYQQYRALYAENGRQASLDAQGQAAGLTGGYGNSYAVGAGNAAYNQYLQQLNDRALDIYDRAYQRWQGDGDRLAQNYSMARDMGEQDYSRWTDQYNRGLAERQYAQQAYGDEYNRDYGQYSDQQTESYKLLMSMIEAGMTPSAELMRRAGMPEGDLATLQKYYADQAKGKSTGGSGSGGDPLAEYANKMVDTGYWSQDYAVEWLQEAEKQQKRDTMANNSASLAKYQSQLQSIMKNLNI